MIEYVRAQSGQRLTVPCPFRYSPMNSVMQEVRDRPVSNSDFDPRFKRGREDRTMPAVGMPCHSNPPSINESKRLQVIDGSRCIPKIFSMNRPFREPLVEVRCVVGTPSRCEPLTVAEIIPCERHKARFSHVDRKRKIWMRRAPQCSPGEPNCCFFSCPTGGAVEANDSRSSSP